MIQKNEILPEYQWLYDDMKRILTDEAFTIWSNNAKTGATNQMPEQYLRPKEPSVVAKAAKEARDSVSGYSDSNNTRKAVELLADAIESTGL